MNRNLSAFLAAFVLFGIPSSPAPAKAVAKEGSTLSTWLVAEKATALAKIDANISPAGTLSGFVMASPSMNDPNYYFHWSRDAALTMDALVKAALDEPAGASRTRKLQQVAAYVSFSRHTQLEDTLSGTVADHFSNLGEPKYNTDGSGFTGEWGRPQSDGPALRAMMLLRFLAAAYLPNGMARTSEVVLTPEFYAACRTVIDTDLEYLVYRADQTTFDIWEETRGHHFYTELVQRRALILGAVDAMQQGQLTKARTYSLLAITLQSRLLRYWDESRGYLVETLNRDGGTDYKVSNLDSAVVLGVLHAYDAADSFFAPTDPHLLATVVRLKDVFRKLYPINTIPTSNDGAPLGVAIGRYAEDRYDGGANTAGNPWPLLTLAMAELDARLIETLENKGQLLLTPWNLSFYNSLPLTLPPLQLGQRLRRDDPAFTAVLTALKSDAKSYFERVRFHDVASGIGLSEQIDRTTGKMHSAYDLTWSYAGFLTALWAQPK